MSIEVRRETLAIEAGEVGCETLSGVERVEVVLTDWGGSGPSVLLTHANGFCAALWTPVALHLRERFRVFGLDVPGHGESPHPGHLGVLRWDRLAQIHAYAARHAARASGDGELALAVGHSFGGTLTFGSSAQNPGLIRRVALLDPVIFPPELAANGRPAGNGPMLAERAKKRRAHWADRDEARVFFSEKELFAGWDRRCFDLYVEEALRESDAGGVELCCAPEIEATIFAENATLDPIGLAPEQQAQVLLIRAANGDFPEAIHRRLVDATPRARFEEMPAGHLIPMELPDAVAKRLADFADE